MSLTLAFMHIHFMIPTFQLLILQLGHSYSSRVISSFLCPRCAKLPASDAQPFQTGLSTVQLPCHIAADSAGLAAVAARRMASSPTRSSDGVVSPRAKCTNSGSAVIAFASGGAQACQRPNAVRQ